MENSVLEGSNGGLFDLEAPSHGNQRSLLGLARAPSFTNWSQVGLANSFHNRASLRKGKSSGPCYPTEAADVSEDEEPNIPEDRNEEGAHKCKKASPWQRMKWTDNMIRLLIAVVARVGDDGGFDGVSGFKRKCRILQKKGKWKMVSKVMNSKGAHVSPQQCEDKFNDLNKRYKKLNDILGRGTCCQVVENPAIMDLMPQFSDKKDIVRKILSSKHLFYREMCAYHNGQAIPNCPDIDVLGCFPAMPKSFKDNNLSEEEEVDSDCSHEEENDDYESNESFDGEGGCSKQFQLPRTTATSAFESEVAQVLKNSNMAMWEKKDWIDKKRLQLLNQTFNVQSEGLEIDKQRFKWLRYRSKKDDHYESLKLENEKMRLESEHGLLFLRRKQLEIDLQISDTTR